MSDNHHPFPTSTNPDSARLPPARPRTRRHPAVAAAPAGAGEAKSLSEHAPASYEVGYKKPPKHTRFRSGHSGNPKGRPRRAASLNTIVRKNLTGKVAVRTPNGEKKITRIEAVIHKAVEQAMKGNPRAIAELLKLYASAVPEEKVEAPTGHEEDLTAADLAILEAYRHQLGQGEGDRP